MKITPTQARQVLTGTKTRHRIRAQPLRSKPKNGPVLVRPLTKPDQEGVPLGVRYALRPELGRAFKLRPDLEGRAVVTSAQWITADWLDARTMRAEGFKNPVDLKLDWLERYDAKWLDKIERAGKDTDREILDRFAQRWAAAPAWLLTLEPVAAEHYLLPASRGGRSLRADSATPSTTLLAPSAPSELAYSDRVVTSDLGPATPSVDPLDAGEVVAPPPAWIDQAEARRRHDRHTATSDLTPEARLRCLREAAQARRVDLSRDMRVIVERLDRMERKLDEAA